MLLPDGQVGAYEALGPLARFPLPIVGALVLALLISSLPQAMRAVGVAHVLRNLQTGARVRLPASNMLVQFVAGSIALVSGQSLDREGPGVHLGAAIGNGLGFQRWLTDEEIRTLTLAGAAASIAAAFNTPLAGVIFVLEVLLVRYEVVRVVAIMLASVVGALVGRLVYGPDPAFLVPSLTMDNHWELALVALLGLVIGLMASGMIAGCAWVAGRTRGWPIWRAFLLAGSCTAVLGLAAPEILGISYHTISALMIDKVTIVTLGGLMVCKLIATTVSVGVGMPAGLIGPTLVIGGAAGALGGSLAELLSPDGASSAGFYAMVGMAAMMGTTLRAPMAALMALVEQTSDPHILFPGMLAVATAEIVAWGLVGRDSVFIRLLQKDGPLRFQRM